MPSEPVFLSLVAPHHRVGAFDAGTAVEHVEAVVGTERHPPIGLDAGTAHQHPGHRGLEVDPKTHRRITLHPDCVITHVELGYATTIHGAQGTTADTCHGLTGPVQHHLAEARSQQHLDNLIAGESEAVLAWLNRIHQAAPGTIEDPATIRLARECAAVDPKGRGLPKHLAAAAREALPDDHKADALRYRLEPWLVEIWETYWPPQQAHTGPRRDEPIPLSLHRSPGIGI